MATVGPASQSVDQLIELLESGVTCARIDLTVGAPPPPPHTPPPGGGEALVLGRVDPVLVALRPLLLPPPLQPLPPLLLQPPLPPPPLLLLH